MGISGPVGDKGPDVTTRGLPRSAPFRMVNDDGEVETYDIWPPVSPDLETGTATVVEGIRAGLAEDCPICRAAAPAINDHVPPEHFGGSKMINTCDPCNNKLGSHTEAAMREWFDQASRVRVSVPGRAEPILNGWVTPRATADGKPLIILDSRQTKAGQRDPFVEHMEPGVRASMQIIEPRAAEFMTGLLKQSFLAAVLLLRGVPNCPSAAEIQTELIAARDANHRSAVQLGDHAAAMNAYRTGLPRNGPRLALLRGELGGMIFPLLSLAGTLLVTWPFPEIDPLQAVDG